MDKLKNWLFDTEKETLSYMHDEITLDQYTIDDYKLLYKIGDNLKCNHIIICYIDEMFLTRSLDYLKGICFVLDYQHIPLTNNIYFFPKQ